VPSAEKMLEGDNSGQESSKRNYSIELVSIEDEVKINEQ